MPRPSEPGGGAAGKEGGGGKGAGPARSCPICGKPADAATRPFCSKRCRDVDLNRWLSGTYVVPGAPTEDEGSE
jgi:endogenous inhibitor of DNA gyrase (YacG/DUF329 family)